MFKKNSFAAHWDFIVNGNNAELNGHTLVFEIVDEVCPLPNGITNAMLPYLDRSTDENMWKRVMNKKTHFD